MEQVNCKGSGRTGGILRRLVCLAKTGMNEWIESYDCQQRIDI
jgi:hypothetical protein